MHYAADLGATKPNAEFYAAIEARTGFAPDALFFVDDRQPNVDAALARGWQAALWTGDARLLDLLAAANDRR